jgi:hypothetical protein
LLKISTSTQEDTRMVKRTTHLGTVEVTADGEGLISHAGVALLVELADRVGLTGALSGALAPTRERRSAHDPGRVLRDVAVMLADGGDCVTDIDAYQGQERLFGARASETTTHRVLKSVDRQLLDRIRAARAAARARPPPAHGCPSELWRKCLRRTPDPRELPGLLKSGAEARALRGRANRPGGERQPAIFTSPRVAKPHHDDSYVKPSL